MGPRHHGATGPVEKAENAGYALKRLFVYLKPYTGLLLVAGLMVILNSVFELAGPYLTGLAVDKFIAKQDSQGLNRTMLLLLGVYLGSWATRAVQVRATIKLGQNVLYAMRNEIFHHLQSLSLHFFDRSEAGDLMSRLTNDTDAINSTLNMGLAQFVGNIVFFVGVLVALLLLNWQLALITMSVLPFMFFSTFFFSKRVRTASRASREKLGAVSAELEENIAGVRVVQAFGREQETIQEFREVNAANRDANVQAQTVTSAFAPTLDVFSTVGIALVLGVGGEMALREAITVGTIVTFIGYVRRFFQPVRTIGMLYAQVQMAIAAAERIFTLLDEVPEVVDVPDARSLDMVKGHIVFENVTFSYKEGEPVLREVSFEAEPGAMVAIVGPTGAGKTTMVNLLMRFYDVDSGSIYIDGLDIRQVQQEDLRRQVGMVLQDTFLFSGTVMENIRYGRLEATDEDVLAAARTAGADQFIQRLPDGYNTELGERGASLSLGQRQLIAIARAILANPRILILDEATSSVDTRTERLIQSALDNLMRGRTSIVIAHRLSTILNADQVLVLCNGRIVERGKHQALLQNQGLYYTLYTSQFGEANGSLGLDCDTQPEKP
ncbi:MAG: ABC transporter ATP-binding protein [Anaerolineae bacterium]|nr:ABC transporter ATP-binding protein [Anaerolineae bacterium]